MRSKSRALFCALVMLCGAAAAALIYIISPEKTAMSMIVIACAAIVSMLAASEKGSSPLYISMLSALTALSVVGRIVFAPTAGFKPCTAVIIIAGITLGPGAGFVCGAFTALVSNIYFGQGIWTIFQMLAWGLIGAASGAFSRILRKSRFILCAFSAVSGFVYSLIMDLFSALWQDGTLNPARFIAMTASSLPFSVMYAVSNVIFILLMFERLSFAVDRVSVKYGLKRP